MANTQHIQRPGNRPNPSVSASVGMSDTAWDITLKILEKIVDLIKSIIILGGILSANISDVFMGSISIGILFGVNQIVSTYNVSGSKMGILISLGSSAIQIFLWSFMFRRNIGFRDLFHWRKLPSDVKPVLAGALLIWLIDTVIDVAPIALLVGNSAYETIPLLYNAMVAFVFIIVFILCGFAEILTSNMRGMLMISAPGMGTRASDHSRDGQATRETNGNHDQGQYRRGTTEVNASIRERMAQSGGNDRPQNIRPREDGDEGIHRITRSK